MKLKKLNKALMAAGLVAGAAVSMPSQAVSLSDDGTGEVLLYPFYTVQGPQNAPRSTLISIVNHNNEIKAVKVRFHEAHNSRDALDFNLYLSEYDVWTGVITRNADGVAQLTTADTSCTIPSSIQSGVSTFSTLAYSQDANNDGGNQNALRTNEGYIEVIEMGVVDPAQTIEAGATAGDGIDTLGEAIRHTNAIPGGDVDANDLPLGCAALQETFLTTGVWAAPVNTGSSADLDNTHVAVSQPTGGLSGTGLIVQSSLGTVAGYNATALKHFYDVQSISNAACTAAIAGAATALHDGAGLYCETSTATTAGVPEATTNRAFDDIHSFKDLDPSTANARSIQTYPSLAMAFPQVSAAFDPDGAATGAGTAAVLEWSENELVSTGVTRGATNVLFAAVRDAQLQLFNAASPTAAEIGGGATGLFCGGFEGVASTASTTTVCANARPVSAVLARNNILNEYVLEQDAAAGVDFKTDVVMTFPTKWFFSDNGLYDATNDVVVDESGETVTALEALDIPPFSSQFVSNSGGSRDNACERFSINSADTLTGGTVAGLLFDREETPPPAAAQNGLVPSPAINAAAPNQNFICHEANVMTLNDGDLLSSRIANGLDATVANSSDGSNSFNIDFPDGFTSGWFNIAFDTAGVHAMTSETGGPMETNNANVALGVTPGVSVTGLPVIGFVVEGLVDGSTAFDGNFTVAVPHKYQ